MIRLVAPKRVMRAVRRTYHYSPKSKAEILDITTDDLILRKMLLKRLRTRPHGHDVMLLHCGHVTFRISTQPGVRIGIPPPQYCHHCTVRDDEMQVRYIRSDLKKKKRRAKMAKTLVIRRRSVLHIKLRRT